MRKLLLIASVILLLVIAVMPGVASAQGICEYSLFLGLSPGLNFLDVLVTDDDPDVRVSITVYLQENPQDPNCPIPVFGLAFTYEDIDGSESLTRGDKIVDVTVIRGPRIR